MVLYLKNVNGQSASKETKMGTKITKEDFEKKIKEKHPFSKLEILEYNGMTKPCKYKCLRCNKEYEIKKADILFKRLNPCDCKKDFYSRYDKLKYFESLYSDYQIKKIQGDDIWVYHSVCGEFFKRQTVNALSSFDSCPYCQTRHTKQESTKEQIEKKLQEHFYGEKYEVFDYKNYNSSCKIRHSCGFVYEGSVASFLQSRGCPRCFRKISKGEQRIKNFLEKEKIDFIPQKSLDKEKNKGRYKFDFFIPKYNLAIEYNGEQHYKEKTGFFDGLEKTKKRDKVKEEYCKRNNIELMIIPYWELENIEAILVSKFNDYRKE